MEIYLNIVGSQVLYTIDQNYISLSVSVSIM